MNIKDATYKWVEGFNAIPLSLVEKAYKNCLEEIVELTPIMVGHTVYVCDGEYSDNYGEARC